MKADHEDWAREVLADPRTVVLDTETTGLYGYTCEIAVLDGKGEFLLNTLVNPQAPVEPGARRVHGITDEELASAPVFSDVWPKLAPILTGRRIVVWNAEFDSAVIRREVHRLFGDVSGNDWPSSWECAMRHYSDWYWDMDDARFMRLNGGHRAGEDCAAVYERLKEMT